MRQIYALLFKLDRGYSRLTFDSITRVANLHTSDDDRSPEVVTQIDVADLLTLFEKGWITRYDSTETEYRYRITENGRKASRE
jgi:hypothetical protein